MITTILCLSIFIQAFTQDLDKKFTYNIDYVASDSVIEDMGNMVQINLTIDIDSIEKYKEIHVAIGSEEGKSEFFYQVYLLSEDFLLGDPNISKTGSQLIIYLGDFYPDIKDKNLNIKLIERKRNASFF